MAQGPQAFQITRRQGRRWLRPLGPFQHVRPAGYIFALHASRHRDRQFLVAYTVAGRICDCLSQGSGRSHILTVQADCAALSDLQMLGIDQIPADITTALAPRPRRRVRIYSSLGGLSGLVSNPSRHGAFNPEQLEPARHLHRRHKSLQQHQA